MENMKEKRKSSVINNPAGLKYSHCEHEQAMDCHTLTKNFVKLEQKSVKKFNPVLGQSKLVQAPGLEIVPHSKMMETYYDMLLTQKRPFNRTKGQIVTTLETALKPCQQMRQIVPSARLISPGPLGKSDRQIKTSKAPGRSISEAPHSILGVKTQNYSVIKSELSKQLSKKRSLAKSNLNKESQKSELLSPSFIAEQKALLEALGDTPSPSKLHESSKVLRQDIDSKM